ncbi:MAG TPA: LysM domain-containing protein [Euzebyales bacterium]|nr:LysM domain-containing protein [Euzebyales bacterium]
MWARRSGWWAVLVIVLGLVAAACGGDGGGGDGDQASAPPTESRATSSDAATSEQAAGDGEDRSDGPRTYVVKSGDTLTEIAERFDTAVLELVEANDIADPDIIDVGQELTIP